MRFTFVLVVVLGVGCSSSDDGSNNTAGSNQAGTGGAGGSAGQSGSAGVSGQAGANAGSAGNNAGGAPAGASGSSGSAGTAGASAGGVAGTGGSNAGSSTGGTAGSGGTVVSCPLTDDFSDSQSLFCYQDYDDTRHSVLDVNNSANGRMTIVPQGELHNHWYSDSGGPFVFREIGGDFVAETRVFVGRNTDMTASPPGQFSAAGFVVRDRTSGPNQQRWLMYNIGHQINSNARELKTTRPGTPSLSTLYLTDTVGGSLQSELRICRRGALFRFFHRQPGENIWTEEAQDASTIVNGNGAAEPTPGVVNGGIMQLIRPDLPSELQLGLIVGNWDAPFDVRGEFDYLRIQSISTDAECTTEF